MAMQEGAAPVPLRRSKNEVARDLARWHFFADPTITEIYWIRTGDAQEERDDEPIKLLEVSEESSETGSIDAFLFTPRGEITFPSVVAMVTPRELVLVQNDLLDLPEGWNLAGAQRWRRENFPDVDAEARRAR